MKTKLAGMGGATQTYVDDVFSTWLYTGNSSTQTITNGIDLADKGGMVWLKRRGPGSGDHNIFDTLSGTSVRLVTNYPNGYISTTNGVTAFGSSGFTMGDFADTNRSPDTYASWTFRKAAKFFDVVTYTGNGVNGRAIPHSLGIAPGMIIVKSTTNTSDWITWHKSLSVPTNRALYLNGTQSELTSPYFPTLPTSSVFYTNGDGYQVNTPGQTYVAYLFAHDTSADGIIQCGSFTTDASGNATVNLGWEPQYVMIKRTDGASSWSIYDTMRGWTNVGTVGSAQYLYANQSNAEFGSGTVQLNATGFITAGQLVASATYIYMAIRRPNKPPTSGTQVYNAIARTGNSATTSLSTGFAPDLVIDKGRDGRSGWFWDKLRGVSKHLGADLTNAEMTITDSILSFDNLGITVGSDTTGSRINGPYPYANWFFKRAPGFFDVVCYTGTGVATTQAHNLGVAPELMIVKRRNQSSYWVVYHKDLGANNFIELNGTGGYQTDSTVFGTTPTSSVFYIGTNAQTNQSGGTPVAYLFATLAGISKVGSYTGNGTSQNIECGFAAGARFVLVKATSTTGDWYVWDTTRGIVAANDPHLSLNTTAAEVTTDDSVDPYSAGFAVNQVAATNINVSSATYIFLAIA